MKGTHASQAHCMKRRIYDKLENNHIDSVTVTCVVFLLNDANIYCGIILIFEDINFEVPKLRYRRDRHCRLYYTDAAVSLGKGKDNLVIVSLHLDFMV